MAVIKYKTREQRLAETEKERHDITLAVGECLMTWSMVERDISMLYCSCMGAPITFGSGNITELHLAVFDSVVSMDARLNMISVSLAWRSGLLRSPNKRPADYVTYWKRLKNEISDTYKKKRHQIAHSDIIQNDDKTGQPQVRLAPFPTLTNIDFKKMPSLTIEQIKGWNKLFWELAHKITNFESRIRVVPMPPL